jgi:hypothetical protein
MNYKNGKRKIENRKMENEKDKKKKAKWNILYENWQMLDGRSFTDT